MSNLFKRRSMMAGAAGLAGAASSLFRQTAEAKPTGPKDLEPRGYVGKLERLPTLDLESNDEMLTSIRIFINGELSQAAARSAVRTLKAKGIDPDAEMSRDAALEALKDDPIVQLRNHSWQHLQVLMWDNLKREFYSNYDGYMAEMEAADKAGPGKLELNPGIEPAYTTHEIHMQPGGYTGDAFAGHIYHYGTNNFYNGTNYQDERHATLAASVPVPKDGKVKRILDIGCSCGQLTVAMKQRFPDAEVWGVDIGAPMVRYSHMRANDLGVDVNFRHALAEDTKFPEGYFDIIVSNILHHEVTREGTLGIFKETHRILRKGGHYYPIDFYTGERRIMRNSYGELRDWMTYRWNHERWLYEYQSVDFPKEMTAVGFDVVAKGMPGYNGNLVATKKA